MKFLKHLQKQKKQDSKKVFGIGAIVGLITGAVAAVFLTPMSGKEARKAVAKQTQVGVDTAKKTLETAKKRGAEIVEDTKTKIQKAKSNGNDQKK